MHCNKRHRTRRAWTRVMLGPVLLAVAVGGAARGAASDDVIIATSLADLLRSARTVISVNQDRINDPELGDKGLSGDAVVAAAIRTEMETTGADPRKADPKSVEGRLLAALEDAIREVMSANQSRLNQLGTGFKGFVPAVFGRMVAERFKIDAKGEGEIKITAPPELVRNRKSLPDAMETDVIRHKFEETSWPKGQLYALTAVADGRPATRVLIPEYYGAACLSCHGEPKGQIDITGYPKEGAKLGDLGGVISITLFR
jgi:hypothetical protein